MNSKKLIHDKSFSLPDKKVWSGRETNPELGIQYWYQAVDFYAAEAITALPKNDNPPDISILGYVCQEGVRRNKGRVGAAEGPSKVRERLAKLAYHLDGQKIGDYGDVNCVHEDLESCQQDLAKVISCMIKDGSFPIVIGGGHDIAYGHFLGLFDAKKDFDNHKFGIINFDAHFDLRPVLDKPNSGTPFNQILTEFGDQVEYFVIGIQQSANTKELFDIADIHSVHYVDSTDCQIGKVTAVTDQLDKLISKVDSIYISIDMDGFSSAYAPGVSAPSPLGFEPDFVLAVLDFILKSKKVISCDLAELNPTYDPDNLTANLAARLVDHIACYK